MLMKRIWGAATASVGILWRVSGTVSVLPRRGFNPRAWIKAFIMMSLTKSLLLADHGSFCEMGFGSFFGASIVFVSRG